MIADASSGIPRIINAVCDAALVYGYALHAKKITVNIVQEVLGDRNKFGLVPLRPAGPPRLVKQPNPAQKNDCGFNQQIACDDVMLPPRQDLAPNTADYERLPLVKASGFREYDARWLIGSEINALGFRALGLGLGTLLHQRGVRPHIVDGP